uniref:Uncharacterized protein n=1 Tax=Candidatus Methanogaster sp. ANME-2c ERB4 TaxID=2759911 RepID=A0A7G9Y071_9EURY|nr:hypothetical protein EGIHLHMO_00002 [Methanosarcinales archaeon ANME-2c ERB4]
MFEGFHLSPHSLELAPMGSLWVVRALLVPPHAIYGIPPPGRAWICTFVWQDKDHLQKISWRRAAPASTCLSGLRCLPAFAAWRSLV